MKQSTSIVLPPPAALDGLRPRNADGAQGRHELFKFEQNLEQGHGVSPRLAMFARYGVLEPVLLDDVADTEAIRNDGTESKMAERRIAAIGSG